jgi:protein-disulfide isomerase
MKLKALFVVLLGSALCLLTACNQNTAALSNTQKSQIDQQVHDYLLAHPEILIDMSKKLQDKMAKEQSQKAIGSIKKSANTLFNDANSPTSGDKAAPITVIEFFDYQCVHCAKMHPIAVQLLANNPNVKVIYKELPIFGKESEYAAAAALAAGKQGKYVAMHNALFTSGDIEGKMTIAKVDAIAKMVNLNLVQLKKDIKSADIQAELKATGALAQSLGIQGTPAFIIAPTNMAANVNDAKITFIPGGAPLETLQEAVNKAK